uniref:Ferritin n=1 Tax=Acrobeloides nanus TaxID=290746 RepID=A0A914CX15_9BILA
MSLIRQNYSDQSEQAVNKTINEILHASYSYLNVAFFVDRDDITHPKLHKFFLELSDKKKAQAEKLLKYQNERGGRVILQTIQKPTRDTWSTIPEALETALNLEKHLNNQFLALCGIADATNDPHFSDFIEEDLLDVEVSQLKELADLLTQAKRAGSGLGEFLFDKEFKS